jgi:hypothetical protein
VVRAGSSCNIDGLTPGDCVCVDITKCKGGGGKVTFSDHNLFNSTDQDRISDILDIYDKYKGDSIKDKGDSDESQSLDIARMMCERDSQS